MVTDAQVPPERVRGCCLPLPELAGEEEISELARLLKALADPTRLQMLHSLRAADHAVCVCDFTAAFGLSQPTVSHHLAKLRAVGLVEMTKEGTWSYWRMADELSPAAEAALGIVP